MNSKLFSKKSPSDFWSLENILKHRIFHDFPIHDDLKRRFELLPFHMQEMMIKFFQDPKKQVSLNSFHEEKMIKNIQDELDRVFWILEKLAHCSSFDNSEILWALVSESNYLVLLSKINSKDILSLNHLYLEIAQMYGTNFSVLEEFLVSNNIIPLAIDWKVQFIWVNPQSVRFISSSGWRNGQFYYNTRTGKYKIYEYQDTNVSPNNKERESFYDPLDD